MKRHDETAKHNASTTPSEFVAEKPEVPRSGPVVAYICCMAMDNRDWYRNLLRKKTGYVERAVFRMEYGEAERKKPFKLAGVWWFVLVVLVGIPALALLVKTVLKAA